MSFRIRLAGRIIEVRALHDEVRSLCGPYLCPEESAGEPDITVTVTDEDIRREEEAVRREDLKAGAHSHFSPQDLEFSAVHRKAAAELAAFDTFLMHGAVAASAGQGFMFTAPSGVGKTTRLRLWVENIPDSIVINGDKPLLRLEGSAVRAFGTPWCGKEGWNTNTSVPLRAILLLSRAGEGEGNSLRKMPFPEAFPRLLHQTHLPEAPDARRRVLYLLRSLSDRVGVYDFRSEPTAEAVRTAWETVRLDGLDG